MFVVAHFMVGVHVNSVQQFIVLVWPIRFNQVFGVGFLPSVVFIKVHKPGLFRINVDVVQGILCHNVSS